jgi:peptidase E
MRQVFAWSGLLRRGDETASSFDLVAHALSLTAAGDTASVCYIPTAVGDLPSAVEGKRGEFAERRPGVRFSALTLFPQPSVPDVRGHLLAQDVLFVEGGSVVNLMAIWRAHGLPEILRECWDAGVVMTGPSAGSLCWHTGGPTDSYRDALDPFTDGLGFLPFSNGVHDDFPDQPRRQAYRRMVAHRTLPPGYATEDGVGLHYVDTALREAVTIRAGSSAWHVEPDGEGGYRERRVPARIL